MKTPGSNESTNESAVKGEQKSGRPSSGEMIQRYAELQRRVEALENNSERGFDQHRLHNAEIQILEESETFPQLVNINALGGSVLLKGGREAANDPQIVKHVAKAVKLQKQALSPSSTKKPKAKGPEKQVKDLKAEPFPKEWALLPKEAHVPKDTYESIADGYAKGIENANKKAQAEINTVEGSYPEETTSSKIERDAEEAKKAIAKRIEEVDAEFKKKDEEAKKKKEWEISGPIPNWGEDPGFARPPTQEYASNDVRQTEAVETAPTKSEEEVFIASQEEVDKLKKSLDEATGKMEKARQAVLEKRSAEAKQKLEALGLTKVEKGMETFKNLSSRERLLLGVALAGLSVATGGTSFFLSMGFSALTLGLRDYEKEKQKAIEKGEELKTRTKLKSAVTGLVFALGTGALVSVGIHGVASIAENFSPMLENIKHFFSPDAVSAVAPAPADGFVGAPQSAPLGGEATLAQAPVDNNAFVPHSPAPTPEVATDGGASYQAPLQESPTADLTSPDIALDTTSPINLNEPYVMGQHDGVDSILKRVLSTVDELKVLPEEKQLELIKSLKDQWSTTMSGASTPNWALKEMIAGVPGTEVHHLDHVRDAFVTLGERANLITTYRN